ncbi:hypothetical protein SCHPADRAFT_892480 [Schizopora paradoxa]|uniref:Uncharacterized protein n=1 Tax=Schizopora paradoxa TaxID=27342 RepID=A0A0H2RZR5_9AGAM|nr:hypothetical protein SCHPADRAFT_892480 [Schizopora paradoxa]
MFHFPIRADGLLSRERYGRDGWGWALETEETREGVEVEVERWALGAEGVGNVWRTEDGEWPLVMLAGWRETEERWRRRRGYRYGTAYGCDRNDVDTLLGSMVVIGVVIALLQDLLLLLLSTMYDSFGRPHPLHPSLVPKSESTPSKTTQPSFILYPLHFPVLALSTMSTMRNASFLVGDVCTGSVAFDDFDLLRAALKTNFDSRLVLRAAVGVAERSARLSGVTARLDEIKGELVVERYRENACETYQAMGRSRLAPLFFEFRAVGGASVERGACVGETLRVRSWTFLELSPSARLEWDVRYLLSSLLIDTHLGLVEMTLLSSCVAGLCEGVFQKRVVRNHTSNSRDGPTLPSKLRGTKRLAGWWFTDREDTVMSSKKRTRTTFHHFKSLERMANERGSSYYRFIGAQGWALRAARREMSFSTRKVETGLRSGWLRLDGGGGVRRLASLCLSYDTNLLLITPPPSFLPPISTSFLRGGRSSHVDHSSSSRYAFVIQDRWEHGR